MTVPDPGYLGFLQHELDSLRAGRCPSTDEPLVWNHPVSDAPSGRLSCSMCDCFGFPAPKSLLGENQNPRSIAPVAGVRPGEGVS